MKRSLILGTVFASLLSAHDALAILDGQPDPAPSPVVALSGETSSGASGFVCTGTLVAANVVLTARHCIEEGEPGCSSTFNGVAKYVRIGVTTENGTYEVASTRVPATNKACGDDIALLVLGSAVPTSDSPSADVRLTKVAKDEAYSAVGYGRTCTDDSCAGGGQRLRKDGLAVECIDCRAGTWRGTADSVCIGDSGGPAFDAQRRVLGVATVGGLGCTTSYYTRLDTHADFLRNTVTTETAKAGVTAPAWTTTQPGGGDAGIGDPSSTDGGGGSDGGTSAAPAPAEEGCAVVRGAGAKADPWIVLLATAMAIVATRRRHGPRRLR